MRGTGKLSSFSIILLKVCGCSQAAGRNSSSIVSGDVSNCSYHLTVHPVTIVRISVRAFFLYAKNTQNLGETGSPRECLFE